MKAPSPLFSENFERLREAAALGPVLDLACGRGRHALAAARQGLRVVALDRNRAFLSELAAIARDESLPIHCVRADLESAAGIPLRDASFGAVLVFRYLHRPLAPAIERLIAPGGVLLYETFTLAQRELEGGPSNSDFLLAEGELPRLFPGLQAIDYEEAVRGDPPSEAVASMLAGRAACES